MASMKAYTLCMLMIFINYGMETAKFIKPLIFPTDTTTDITVSGAVVLYGTDIFKNFGSIDSIISIALTAGVLALFAFSLLVPTLPFVFFFFAINGLITSTYLWQLHLPIVFTAPITMGVLIVYYTGVSQYAGRTTFSGS